MREQDLHALPQTRAQDRIGQVGAGLAQAIQPIRFRRRATAQAAQLREYEPDPVRLLPTGVQLAQGSAIGMLLRAAEPGELEQACVHWTSRAGAQASGCPSRSALSFAALRIAGPAR